MSTKRILYACLLVSGVLLIGCKRDESLGAAQRGVSFLFEIENPSESGVEAMLQAIKARLHLMGHENARVSVSKDRLISVQIPGVSKDETEIVKRRLLQPTRLAFSSVENDQAFFDALQDRLPRDGSIRMGLDGSQSVGSEDRIEYAYLMSDQKEKLQDFIDNLKPPEGSKFWIMPAEQGAAAYLLRNPPQLQNSIVKNVIVKEEPQTGRLNVYIELDKKYRQAFAELTRKQLHRRLAVLVNGEIKSLPTVESVINEAQLRIEPSPVMPEAVVEKEARALATGIKAWGCAGGLRLVEQSFLQVS